MDNSYSVSLHIRSVHATILNSKVIKVVKTSVENFPKRTVATKVIITFYR